MFTVMIVSFVIGTVFGPSGANDIYHTETVPIHFSSVKSCEMAVDSVKQGYIHINQHKALINETFKSNCIQIPDNHVE